LPGTQPVAYFEIVGLHRPGR